MRKIKTNFKLLKVEVAIRMANDDHVTILSDGISRWNRWRIETGRIRPDLSGIDLSGANLTNINFEETDLSGADLRGAVLSSVNLRGCSLSGANCEHATLNQTDLTKANLSRANLAGANLQGADLSDTDLSEAKINGTRFAQSIVTGGTRGLKNLSLSARVSLIHSEQESNDESSSVVAADLQEKGGAIAEPTAPQFFTAEFALDVLDPARIAVRALPPPDGMSDDVRELFDAFVTSVENAYQRNVGLIGTGNTADVKTELPLWGQVWRSWIVESAKLSGVVGAGTLFSAGFTAGMLYHACAEGGLESLTSV